MFTDSPSTVSTVNASLSQRTRTLARLVLGVALLGAGVAHLGPAREEFHAQVPGWVGINADIVVFLSGVIEIALGGALLFVQRRRAVVGLLVGFFFIAIFPGNISQFIDGDDAFGLTTDAARRNRLFFQPVLVAWAWWSTGAISAFFKSNRADTAFRR